jgi:hypothetical protein
MKSTNKFVRGQSTYTCRCCGRLTRQTGRGDNDLVGLCAECYDLAGEENSLSDNGEFYNGAQYILETIQAVASKGGNASCWDDLKVEALRVVNAA